MAGSIQKINRPNPWRARYRAPDGRERSKSFARKIDAEKWLTAQLADSDRGVWTDPKAGTVTVEEWSESWLSGLHGLKPKTIHGYQSLLRSRVVPAFGEAQLKRITPAAVRAWIAEMADEGLSPDRIRQARQLLSAMLDQAVNDGLIARNPAKGVRVPPVRPRRQLFLTADELERLADAAERRQRGAGALIWFLGWSGLRWGEAVALRGRAVNVERRRVRVEEAATEINGRLDFGTPKTHEARTVIVPRFVVERIAPLAKAAGRDGLVFTATGGGPLRTSNFRKAVWTKAVAKAGLPEDLKVHDLRDTAASLMISSGASIKAVQRALGHATASMTLDRYAGLFEDDLEALADRLESRYGDKDRNGHLASMRIVDAR